MHEFDLINNYFSKIAKKNKSALNLNSSNYFLENSQTKYLNALLDNVGKKLRTNA